MAFLEFGWGDRVYYPAKKKTLGMTLSAVMVPTPAVMHVAGHLAPPGDDYGYELISVELGRAGSRRLAAALAAEFERPAGGRAAPISRGLFPHSLLLPRTRGFPLVQHVQHLDGPHVEGGRRRHLTIRNRDRK